MHKYKYLLFLAVIFLVFTNIYFFSRHKPVFVTKTISFNFYLKNESNQRINKIVFSVGIPKSIKANQFVSLDGVELSNNQKEIEIEKINPWATKQIGFLIKVEKGQDASTFFDKKINYLANSSHLDIDNNEVRQLANQLKGNTQFETSKNIYDWLVSNIESTAYIHKVNGSLHTLKTKQGDCTEFAYLFVSLARANKIPSRVVKGLYIPHTSAVVDPMDFHDWAEFYDGDKWVIVDAQKQHFDTEYGNYLLIDEFHSQNQPRFSISDQRISVSFE